VCPNRSSNHVHVHMHVQMQANRRAHTCKYTEGHTCTENAQFICTLVHRHYTHANANTRNIPTCKSCAHTCTHTHSPPSNACAHPSSTSALFIWPSCKMLYVKAPCREPLPKPCHSQKNSLPDVQWGGFSLLVLPAQ
jgi:hypothetical protein